tara:strand:- start:28 stop:210 length:183 start_codon:yes stop_codon:yes gene_type:complete
MKKKVYKDAIVQIMDMIRYNFEDSPQEYVIEDLDDILSRFKIANEMRKRLKEWEKIEKTI